MRKLALTLLALPLVLACSLIAQAPPTLAPSDQAAIRTIINAQIETWNRHDMKAYTADMADDVQWVNVVGMVWRGKAEVYQAHETYHQTIFRTRNLSPLSMLEIRAVTPDVAIVTASGEADGFTTTSGRAMPPSTSMLTYVLVRRGGRRWIVEGHNTTVDPRATNPIKH